MKSLALLLSLLAAALQPAFSADALTRHELTVDGVTREALDRMSISAAENVLSVFDGTPIIANVVNAEVLTKGR